MSEEKQHLERKGYRMKSQPEGARLLCFKGKWNGIRGEKEIDIAALVVQEINRDSRFAAYFKKLLES